MPSIGRRRMLNQDIPSGSIFDEGLSDVTMPEYLTRPMLGARSARILSGRGTFAPGYTIIGDQPDAMAETLQPVRVLKMVSPLTGQGPADPRATGFFYGMDYGVLPARILRQRRAVPANQGYTVVVRPRTAIRRMDNRGVGTVGYV